MKELSIAQVAEIAHALARKIMEYDEPIPEFGTRFEGKLESCLKTPFQTYGGKDLYPRLEDKAAALFYLLIKNHPFQNGNKRIAVTSLLTFLSINNQWLSIPAEELYRLALWVAESPSIAKEGTIQAIRDSVKRYLNHWELDYFKDGSILRSAELNKLCRDINAIEQLISVSKTNFRDYKDGMKLMSQDLNNIMMAVDRIRTTMNLPKTQWKHLPVQDRQVLRDHTLNELWNAILGAISEIKKYLS